MQIFLFFKDLYFVINLATCLNSFSCWLDDSGAVVYMVAIPHAVIFLATILLLINTFLAKDTPPELIDANLRGRQRSVFP